MAFVAGDGTTTELTYAEVHAGAQQVASRLVSLERGDRALLLFHSGPEFLIAFLGCLVSGVVAVPVPIPLGESGRRRLAGVLRDSEARVVLSTADIQGLVADADRDPGDAAGSVALLQGISWILVDAADACRHQDENIDRVGDLAFLQYTSGSTGSPRGVAISHENLSANEASIQRAFGIDHESTIVSWLPFHHDMGLIGGLLQPLYSGTAAVITDPLSFISRPAHWLELVSGHRRVVSGGPNFAFDLCTRRITDPELAGLDLSGWDVAFNGAAPVFEDTLTRFSQRFAPAGFRHAAHQPCYGLAEATLLVASVSPGIAPVARSFDPVPLEQGLAVPADDSDASRRLIGYPVGGRHHDPRIEVRVADSDSLQPVDEGVVGEVIVDSPGNGRGYWNDEESTDRVFAAAPAADGRSYLRTGDLGFRLGDELFLTGRLKDLLIVDGRNVHPEDLERDLDDAHPAVRPGCAAAYAVTSSDSEVIEACVEVREGTDPDDLPKIIAAIRSVLSERHAVACHRIVLAPPRSVAKTTSGKVQRSLTRDLIAAGTITPLLDWIARPRNSMERGSEPGQSLTEMVALRADGLAPDALDREAVEDLLATWLRQQAGIGQIPANQPLTATGLDSLAAMRLTGDIAALWEISIPPSDLLSARMTFRDLADLVLSESAPRTPSLPVDSAATAPYELNAAQEALWFLHRADPRRTDYNVSRAFEVEGGLSSTRLAAALTTVIDRHPALRLGIATVDGAPRPEIADHVDPDLREWDAEGWSQDDLEDAYRRFADEPFEIGTPGLMRVALATSEKRQHLMLCLHHLVCDLRSVSILMDELVAVLDDGSLPPLTEEISPGSAERRRLVVGEKGSREYWGEALSGAVPADLSWAQGTSSGPQPLTTGLSATTTDRLVRRAAAIGVTMNTMLLAGFCQTLHRLSDRDDLVVGVPVDVARSPARIGYEVNVLPFRSQHAPGQSVDDWVWAHHHRFVAGLDHRDLPLAEIVRSAGAERTSVESPLTEVLFSYYGETGRSPATGRDVVLGDVATALGERVRLLGSPLARGSSQGPLSLDVLLDHGALTLAATYRSEIVSGDQVRAMLDLLLRILTDLADDSATEVDLLGRLDLAVDPAVGYGTGPHRLLDRDYLADVEAITRRSPDAIAVTDGTDSLSYAAVDAIADRVASRLRQLGTSPEDHVVVVSHRCLELPAVLLGLHRAASSYVPIAPQEPRHRMMAMLGTVAPAVVIATSERYDEVAAALGDLGLTRTPLLALEELLENSAPIDPGTRQPAVAVDPLTAAYVMFTSGSTGVPKAVVCTREALTNHLWHMAADLDLARGPGAVGVTSPLSVDMSLWQMLSPLLVGGTCWVPSEAQAASPSSLIELARRGVGVMELVPTDILALLDHGIADDPGALHTMLSTGAPLTTDLARRWLRSLPDIPLINAFGATEVSDDVSLARVRPGYDSSRDIGSPLANTTLRVLTADLRLAPIGMAGELYAGGIGVARGYLGDPRRTALAFVPDPLASRPGARTYRLGDLGRLRIDGGYDVLGRADDQISLRGQRIERGEVEAALRAVPIVIEAAVTLELVRAERQLVAHLVLTDGVEGPRRLTRGEETEVRAELLTRLPRGMVPSIYVAHPELTRTSTSKIDYRVLDHGEAAPATHEEAESAPSEVVEQVRAVWSTVLDTAVSDTDSFFALGGHSMKAMAMTDRVAALLDADIGVELVFAHPHLADFARAALSAPPRPDSLVTAGVERAELSAEGPFPANGAQLRFQYLRELDPHNVAFHMPGVVRLSGHVDEDAVDRALSAVAQRHPVLRADFSWSGSDLVWSPTDENGPVTSRRDVRQTVAAFGSEAADLLVKQQAAESLRGRPSSSTLYRVSDDEYLLLVVVSHMVSDGWSVTLILAEFARYYAQLTSGSPIDEVEPDLSFPVACLEESLESAAHEEAVLTEWQPFAGEADRALSPFQDTGAAPCPATTGSARGRLVVAVPDDVAAAVDRVAGELATTPFVVFATLTALLCHRGSQGEEEIMLGTILARRGRPDLQTTVGPLINVGILIASLDPAESIETLVASMQQAVLRAQRAAPVPVDRISRLLPAQSEDGTPFLTMVNFESLNPIDIPPVPEVEMELCELTTDESPYPLAIDIAATEDGGYRLMLRHQPWLAGDDQVSDLVDRLVDQARRRLILPPASLVPSPMGEER